MASSCGLCVHLGTFFVKVFDQMSMVTLQIIFWAQLQKALCFLMFFSRTISTLTFFPVNSTEERKEQVRITRPNSFILGPCLRDEERGLGPCTTLSVMPNAAPDIQRSFSSEDLYACVLSCFSHVRLCDPMDCSLPSSSVHEISQAKNTGVGCHFLLQGISQTQYILA